MWVHTTSGFYSAVAHRDEPGTIIVRARSRGDLVRLRKAHPDRLKGREILRTFRADYPYRMLMVWDDWSGIMADEAAAIDYDNFKNALTPAIADRHRLLLRVWQALFDIEYEADAKVHPPNSRPWAWEQERRDLHEPPLDWTSFGAKP